MKTASLKIIIIVAATMAAFAGFAHAQESVEFNRLDAISSASNKLRIDSAKIYRTHAVFNWWEYYEYDNKIGAYRLEWGTDPEDYSNTLDLLPYNPRPETNETTISSLEENTEYYGRFFRDYNRKIYLMEFRFNTPPLPNSVRYGRIAPRFPRAGDIAEVELFTISGRRLLRLPVSRETVSTVLRHTGQAPGMYIARFNAADGRLIASERVLVGR